MGEAAADRIGLPGFDRRKVAKRKFLCSDVESLKVLSKKISELSMFFRNWRAAGEIKFPLLESGSVLKDYDIQRVQTFSKRFKTWTAFP